MNRPLSIMTSSTTPLATPSINDSQHIDSQHKTPSIKDSQHKDSHH